MSANGIYLLERHQRIEVPQERAFGFFSDALNLEALTPPWVHFRLLTQGPIEMGAGALLDYRLRIRGFPVRWTTRIESWEPPVRFLDIQLRGPYALWEHTHTFEPDGEDAVVIGDRIRYTLPLGPLGRLAHAVFVRRDLERIFAFRQTKLAELLTASESSG